MSIVSYLSELAQSYPVIAVGATVLTVIIVFTINEATY